LSGRRRYIRTTAMIKRVRERVRSQPKQSGRKLASQLNLSTRTMRCIISEDLAALDLTKNVMFKD
jgi:hypothetical protein